MFEWFHESHFWGLFLKFLKNGKKFFWRFWHQRVPPLEKNQKFPKTNFFSKNCTFSFWICILHVLSFVLRHVTIIYLRISNFDLFMLEIFHFLPWSYGSQYYQNYCSKTVVYGVYGQLKIKKIKYKSFLGFRLSFYSFRMPKTNPGHNGPPTLLNVIPEHTLNRVNFN